MTEFDSLSDAVVRAAYQISGLTGSPVNHEQIRKVVPVTIDELKRVIIVLQERGLSPKDSDADHMALTSEGLRHAGGLAPLSEPPMFSDI